MDPRQILVQAAMRYGIDPRVALSLWQQESGGSTDPTLVHGTPTRHGRARGPFGIMPSLHPQADLASFESQADYAMRYLSQVGLEGYYGRGKPPPGHPTTDQYVNQVTERANAMSPTPMSPTPMSFTPSQRAPGLLGEPPHQAPRGLMDIDPELGLAPIQMAGLAMMGAPANEIGPRAMQGLLAAQRMRQTQGGDPQKMQMVRQLVQMGIPQEQAIAMVFTGGASLQPGGGMTPAQQFQIQQYQAKTKAAQDLARRMGLENPEEFVDPKDVLEYGKAGSPLTASQLGNVALTRDEISGALDNIDQLIGVFDKGGWNQASFGTLGDVLRKGQSMASIVDTVTGTELSKAGVFPEDLAKVRSLVALSAMPVARAVIDSKGPLTDQERQAANRILGYGGEGKNKELVGPMQAIEDLRTLQSVLRRRKDVQEAYLGYVGGVGQAAAPDDDGDDDALIQKYLQP